MTLVMALKWATKDGEAVLLTSDSRVTTDVGVAFEMKKIYPILFGDKHVAVVGVSGNTALAKQGFQVAQDVLTSYAERNYPISFLEFKTAVGEIEDRLVKRLSQLRSYGIQPSFQMVVGSVDLDGSASIYRFDDSGLSEPVHDSPGYAIIGSGMVTGGILLLRMLGYDQDLELGLVSAFIVDLVSEVDTSVGSFLGESYFMRVQVENGKRKIALGPLIGEALSTYKKQIGARRELVKRLWRACDQYGEDKVSEIFEQMKKG
jgi:hypothetical protein